MEKFWAVILIFVVVAAAGLMYVNQVYNPQRDTQEAMAEMANDTLSVVKSEIGDGTNTYERRGDDVEETLEDKLGGEEADISIEGSRYDGEINGIEDKLELDNYYKIEIIRADGKKTKVNIRKKL